MQHYVTHCTKCQVNKAERLKVGGLLYPLEIPNGKWESISMDFIVELPTSCKSWLSMGSCRQVDYDVQIDSYQVNS